MEVQNTIEKKLTTTFQPTHLDVVNESHGHNVAAGSETHFKVTIVSESFSGLNAVQRHRKIYATLSEELEGAVHALALHAFANDEWQAQAKVPESPPCLGGSKR